MPKKNARKVASSGSDGLKKWLKKEISRIVADSIPAKEHEETLNKAKGLLRALEIAEKQL